MARKSLDDATLQTLRPLLDAAKVARTSGSAIETAAAYRTLWEAVPQPYAAYDLQALCSATVLKLIRVRAWDEAAGYLPILAEQYGVDDPMVLVWEAVITFHRDPAAGRIRLAAALDRFGPKAFHGFPDYVQVARGGELPYAPPAVSPEATELALALGERIDELAERGNSALEVADWDAARGAYQEALELVPEPRRNWEAATWLYASIGDAQIGAQQWAQAKDNLYFATQCPGGITNPYIQLRLGEAEYELGDFDAAANALLAAYLLVGDTIFAEEPSKYLGLLRERGLLPN